MKRYLLTIAILLSSISAIAAPKVSLLTCGPTDDYVFYLYGHTAIRVQQDGQDIVYNYGYFSLDQKNFILNFMLGKPMYSLGVTSFDEFLWEYSSQGRSVVEQELNLTETEALLLANKLSWNALPENRDYQYNFYFDNCATRPRDLLEEAIGDIKYQLNPSALPTFREAIRDKSHSAVWYTMGADLCLGWKTDRQMSLRDAAFLPSYLEQELDSALRGDTNEPIVTKKVVWVEQSKTISNPYEAWRIPWFVFVILIVLLQIRPTSKIQILYHRAIYTLLGIGGVTIWFLAFISEHPHTWPNANMLFMHPFWFVLAITTYNKRWGKPNKWLYFGNFVAIVIYLILGLFLQELPKHLHILAIGIALDQFLRWRESRNHIEE
ncbi:hypothetical protein IX308_000026 [Porphyromonas levii]|uniref:lipoprotein N-acyltransferase Lnb domain-containing protein n=1 Tax=Porphyromonas levii TaxID=28114 RepID=UPI0020133F2A|nr:DUF4105 domain-containing protein [Porphyromonas levii]MBR8783868.1 hypothetical protein [Porphyromonas levii]